MSQPTQYLNIRTSQFQDFIEFVTNENNKSILAKIDTAVFSHYRLPTSSKLTGLFVLFAKDKYGTLFDQAKGLFTKLKYNNGNLTIKIGHLNRTILYGMCLILGLKFEVRTNTQAEIVPCTRWGTSYQPGGPKSCGCNRAPKIFHDNHYDNSYDDDISYSKYAIKYDYVVIRSID